MSEFTAYHPEASSKSLQSACDELMLLALMLKLLEPEPLARTHTHARKQAQIIDLQARDVRVGEPGEPESL